VPHSRFGVALLVPEPVAGEVDGLRRALGDGALGRIPAHLTLVPPVNVRADAREEAEEVVRSAAAACPGPLRLTLGPATTFSPVTPVVYLAVSGPLDRLAALREKVFRPPLARPLTHDFVPHVTLAEELPPDRIAAAVAALGSYTREVGFDGVALLEEGDGHRWSPVAVSPFGPPAVVGRGGLPLELATAPGEAALPLLQRLGAPDRFTVTARRGGEAVGVAECRLDPGDAGTVHLVGLAVSTADRRTGVGSQLLAAACSHAASLGAVRLACAAPGPDLAGFLRHRGFTARSGSGLERSL
jgi:2'-5' RNA ligase